MKIMGLYCAIISLLVQITLHAQTNNWNDVEKIIGKSGKVIGDVFRVTFPRTDLDVTVDGNKIDPALALTAWVAIDAIGNVALLMGNLVLVESEVEDVIESMVKNGLQINAMHNQLLGEFPRLVYMSIGGTGTPEELAHKIKSVLSDTNIPVESDSIREATEGVNWADIESDIGLRGETIGEVLQFTLPRLGSITMNGNELPFTLGLATSMRFQRFAEKVVSTGVFVLTADEINPVIKALTENGIRVTSVNSQLATENPHLFFVHYWAYDYPHYVVYGLRTALGLTKSKL